MSPWNDAVRALDSTQYEKTPLDPENFLNNPLVTPILDVLGSFDLIWEMLQSWSEGWVGGWRAAAGEEALEASADVIAT